MGRGGNDVGVGWKRTEPPSPAEAEVGNFLTAPLATLDEDEPMLEEIECVCGGDGGPVPARAGARTEVSSRSSALLRLTSAHCRQRDTDPLGPHAYGYQSCSWSPALSATRDAIYSTMQGTLRMAGSHLHPASIFFEHS